MRVERETRDSQEHNPSTNPISYSNAYPSKINSVVYQSPHHFYLVPLLLFFFFFDRHVHFFFVRLLIFSAHFLHRLLHHHPPGSSRLGQQQILSHRDQCRGFFRADNLQDNNSTEQTGGDDGLVNDRRCPDDYMVLVERVFRVDIRSGVRTCRCG